MFGRISTLLMAGCAAAAIGVVCAPQANAQSYNDQRTYDGQPGAYSAPDYGQDTSAEVGGIVVTPSYGPDQTYEGIPTRRVYASRVVPIDDLDLSTRWGVHELHSRVVRAASDACNQLDAQWPQGLYPIDSNDGNCKARAIRHAMRDAPITYDGYDDGY
jgi:UrcA family protein